MGLFIIPFLVVYVLEVLQSNVLCRLKRRDPIRLSLWLAELLLVPLNCSDSVPF